MANKNNNQNVRCSFCGKAQEMVKRIVAGPNAYICDECINVCTNIMEDEHYEENLGYVRNFYKAITLCDAELVFLSDQDEFP